jgi:hypothetical protein
MMNLEGFARTQSLSIVMYVLMFVCIVSSRGDVSVTLLNDDLYTSMQVHCIVYHPGLWSRSQRRGVRVGRNFRWSRSSVKMYRL